MSSVELSTDTLFTGCFWCKLSLVKQPTETNHTAVASPPPAWGGNCRLLRCDSFPFSSKLSRLSWSPLPWAGWCLPSGDLDGWLQCCPGALLQGPWDCNRAEMVTAPLPSILLCCPEPGWTGISQVQNALRKYCMKCRWHLSVMAKGHLTERKRSQQRSSLAFLATHGAHHKLARRAPRRFWTRLPFIQHKSLGVEHRVALLPPSFLFVGRYFVRS